VDGALADTSIIDLLPSFLVTHPEVPRPSQIVVACAFNEVTEKKCKTRSRVSSDS
jgi:hypothetical protein